MEATLGSPIDETWRKPECHKGIKSSGHALCTPSRSFQSHPSTTTQTHHSSTFTNSNMVHIGSVVAALALAFTSVEAGCYGISNAGFSATLGKDRHEEHDHVRNMCRGYTDGSGFHRGALQDVRALRCQICSPFTPTDISLVQRPTSSHTASRHTQQPSA